MQRRGISSMHLPLWETTAGPDYQEVQHILNQFWIPDYISSHTEFILNYDCIVIPDKSLAWYILEANAMKEEKVRIY